MSSSAQLDLSDSSSLDDSDLDELLQDDDCEITILLLVVKELEDRARLLNRRRDSIMGHNYIYRNRALGHVTLVDDYFAEFFFAGTDPCRRFFANQNTFTASCTLAFAVFASTALRWVDKGLTVWRSRTGQATLLDGLSLSSYVVSAVG